MPNAVLLGAFAALPGAVELASVQHAIKRRLPVAARRAAWRWCAPTRSRRRHIAEALSTLVNPAG
jgi:Pyruvate/2-oxoacid:ferredoxin oxidoreductase gamma subunit